MPRADPAKLTVPRSLIGAPLEDVACWVVSICLTFGCSVPTAYRVAAEFVAGVERMRVGGKP